MLLNNSDTLFLFLLCKLELLKHYLIIKKITIVNYKDCKVNKSGAKRFISISIPAVRDIQTVNKTGAVDKYVLKASIELCKYKIILFFFSRVTYCKKKS